MIRCDRCKGTGQRQLSPVERQTLAALSWEWRSTGDVIQRLSGVKATALCNRLVRLKELGLIESQGSNVKEWRRK